MSRCTPADVQNIFDTNRTSTQIQACINVASEMVTDICTAVPGSQIYGGMTASSSGGIVLTTTELFNIELFLSCHFVNLGDPIALQEKIGESMQRSFPESVTTAWGLGLNQTVFGQQAVAMDRTGGLAALGLKKARFRSSRREDSDQFTQGLTKSTSSFKTI